MKFLFLLIAASITQLWAQVNLDRNALLGIPINYETNYTEKTGTVKKGSILWKDLLNACEPDFGINSNSNPYISNRCCYKKLDEIGIVGEPLYTVGGVHGMASVPKIQKFGNNHLVSFTTAQFQKVKLVNTIKQQLITCLHVVYENTSGIDPWTNYNIFTALEKYAASSAGSEWKLEYFYIDGLVKTPCERIQEFGDVNTDGRASLSDVTRLKKDYLDKGLYEKKYDFNNDGKLDSTDGSLLTDYVNKKLECYK